jgi:hypothetical protein
MRTKLCVLGAVLGTMPVVPLLWASPVHGREEPRGAAARSPGPSPAREGAEPLPQEGVPAAVEPGAPKHPCELITVMKVPCDPSTATCEYTYWECPQQVKPLRA